MNSHEVIAQLREASNDVGLWVPNAATICERAANCIEELQRRLDREIQHHTQTAIERDAAYAQTWATIERAAISALTLMTIPPHKRDNVSVNADGSIDTRKVR